MARVHMRSACSAALLSTIARTGLRRERRASQPDPLTALAGSVSMEA